jgi:hypothetical protein
MTETKTLSGSEVGSKLPQEWLITGFSANNPTGKSGFVVHGPPSAYFPRTAFAYVYRYGDHIVIERRACKQQDFDRIVDAVKTSTTLPVELL